MKYKNLNKKMTKEIKAICFQNKEEASEFINPKLEKRYKGQLGYVILDFKNDRVKGCLVVDEKDLEKI